MNIKKLLDAYVIHTIFFNFYSYNFGILKLLKYYKNNVNDRWKYEWRFRWVKFIIYHYFGSFRFWLWFPLMYYDHNSDQSLDHDCR